LVREAESGPATGGRRAVLLEMNPHKGVIVGIDMGVSHLGILATDFSARVLDELETPFKVGDGPEAGLHTVDHYLRQLLERNHLMVEQVAAIGMAVPGPVIADQGIVASPPIMPGWDRYPIRVHLEELWGLPVTVNNDAELGAVGEWAYGAGRGARNLVYIKVGSGIGSGLIMDGHIYRGETGSAGEIGHITIRDDGPVCSCGNHGCLEAMSGGTAIARRGREAVRSGRRTQLTNQAAVDCLTARDVFAAARLGDLIAQQIISEAGVYLGIAIASLVNVFNPGMVVIGGGVAQMGDLLLDPIRRTVAERSLRSAAQVTRINAAVLGRRSTGMGAVVMALDQALNHLMEIA
jgi:glucokinase-like ROK family protein